MKNGRDYFLFYCIGIYNILQFLSSIQKYKIPNTIIQILYLVLAMLDMNYSHKFFNCKK